MNMLLLIQLDILDFIFKGILIGVIASAPMGPVGILCIQRTLNKGRWYGFITGVGAAISDIMEPLQDPTNQFILQISGSIILMLFGIYCFVSDPTKKMRKGGKTKGTLFHNGLTAFLVTFSNPLIIFLFVATFAQFAFIQPSRPIEMGIGLASIPLGALIWWYGLTWLVNKIHDIFNMNGILIINKIIGSVVIIFSLIMLIGTIFNLYHLPSYY